MSFYPDWLSNLWNCSRTCSRIRSSFSCDMVVLLHRVILVRRFDTTTVCRNVRQWRGATCQKNNGDLNCTVREAYKNFVVDIYRCSHRSLNNLRLAVCWYHMQFLCHVSRFSDSWDGVTVVLWNRTATSGFGSCDILRSLYCLSLEDEGIRPEFFRNVGKTLIHRRPCLWRIEPATTALWEPPILPPYHGRRF